MSVVRRGGKATERGDMTMVGSIRLVRVTLTSLALLAGLGLSPRMGAAADLPAKQAPAGNQAGKDAAAGKPGAKTARDLGQANSRAGASPLIAQPGDDPARPFVPLRASTVDDRRRLEVVRLYSAARALEDRRAWTDAVSLLQEALKLDPGSIAVARRLSRIYIGALGRPDLALEYGKRVLAIEPGDSETFTHLVDYYRKNDPAGALALLNDVLANPKLDAHAPGRLLAEYELGNLYSGRLHQTDKAADAFAKVLDALDDRSANRLSHADQSRVLGDRPEMAYFNFGLAFIAAKRYELAVKALEHGLVYDDDNSQISLVLADTLLKLNKGEQALSLVERHIERQTSFVEAYELLTKVMKALKREKEITPRLEAAARRDSKNVPLQYILADRYRETGEVDKAEALYKGLLTSQPTPETYRALAASLLKRKKAADLLKVMSEAWMRPESQEAIKPQLQAAAADDLIAEAMLDAGLEQSGANPTTLPKSAHELLSLIANNPGRNSHNKIRRLGKLLQLQRLNAEQNPSGLALNEIYDTLRRIGNYAEAATVVEQLIAKYPNAKSVSTLVTLADLHRRAGHNEAVKVTLREAMQLDPADGGAQLLLANVLSDAGQVDDAVRVLREASKKEPNNPGYDFGLGRVLARFGRNDEAIKVFENLLKRYADSDEIVKDIRPMLSLIYVNQGDYAKGEAELELLLQRNPDEPGVNNDLGYLYAEQGKNLDKAESMIRKALSATPEDSVSTRAYLDSLGWVLFKRGKAKEALETLQKAVEIMKADTEQNGSNPDATILEHLGDVHFQLQQLDKASDAWRQAAQSAEQAIPPDKRLPEIRKKLDSLDQLGPIPKPSSNRTP
ncbi:MAG: tetratricopeptide repeat protein [Isosphaerales bacterium]